MGWFGLLESRTEGMSATELVERHLCWKAPLFGKSFSERGLPPASPVLRRDRSLPQRPVGGKLIRERSTKHGTKSDLSRDQHQEGDQAYQ